MADTLKNNLMEFIRRLDTGGSVSSGGGVATIPYPTGFNMSNTIIVNQYLLAGGILYPAAAMIETLQSDGIHVKNTGGAPGYIYVDVAKRMN